MDSVYITDSDATEIVDDNSSISSDDDLSIEETLEMDSLIGSDLDQVDSYDISDDIEPSVVPATVNDDNKSVEDIVKGAFETHAALVFATGDLSRYITEMMESTTEGYNDHWAKLFCLFLNVQKVLH